MLIEYKIKFEEGGLSIIQRVTNTPQTTVVSGTEQANLGKEFKPDAGTAITPPGPRPQGATTSTSSGTGEPGSPTTGGGGPGIPGLTLVFGSVVGATGLSTLGSGEPGSPTPGGQGKPGATAH